MKARSHGVLPTVGLTAEWSHASETKRNEPLKSEGLDLVGGIIY